MIFVPAAPNRAFYSALRLRIVGRGVPEDKPDSERETATEEC
jgi:hypothetical protein